MQWQRRGIVHTGDNTTILRVDHEIHGNCVLKRSGAVADKDLVLSLQTLRHPNILLPLEVLLANGEVLEFYEPRQQQFLEKSPDPQTTYEHIKTLAGALAYLHDNEIVHRDVRPDNVFHNDKIELYDFDHAVRPGTAQAINTSEIMPPEAKRNGPVDYSFDIWQLGYIARRFTGGFVNGSYEYDTRLTPKAKSVISKCLQLRPERRYQHGSELVEALENTPFTKE